MAQHFTGFTEFLNGYAPDTAFDRLWGDLSAWLIASGVQGSVDNRVMRSPHVAGAYSTEKILRWTTPGTGALQAEAVTRMKVLDTTAAPGLVVRAAGTTKATGRGYVVLYIPISQTVALCRVFNGVYSVIQEVPFAMAPNTFYYVRLRANGPDGGSTDVRAKVWRADQAEPGWLVSGTDPVGLAAGGVALYADLNGSSYFDSINYADAGETATIGGTPGAPPVWTPIPIVVGSQRLTLFEDDDMTPIGDGVDRFGVVDASGVILDPTCSTNPAHSRPFLRLVDDGEESQVNFREGSSRIGWIEAWVLDKRRDMADWQSGWFTRILAKNGETQQVGRRAVFQQQQPGGEHHLVIDGVITDVKQARIRDSVWYKLSLRDIRERERKTRVFTKAFNTAVFPVGATDGYGRLANGSWLIPPTAAVHRGVFESADWLGVASYPGRVKLDVPARGWGLTQEQIDRLRNLGQAINVYNEADGSFGGLRFANVIVEWRPENSGSYWRTIADMPFVSGNDYFVSYFPNLFTEPDPQVVGGLDPGSVGFINTATRFGLRWMALNALDPDLRPTIGQRVEVRVRSASAPTAQVPLYIEKNGGQLLKDLYDGVYSDEPPRIRYNAAAMAALIAEAPVLRAIIDKPENDLRKFAEQNIYKALGWAPSINEFGEITPIKDALPDASETLQVLDANNVADGDWAHGMEHVVTRVVYTYKRDWVVPDDPNAPKPAAERLRTRDVTFDRWSTTATIFGEKKLEYRPVTMRAISSNSGGVAESGDTMQEDGAKLAVKRSMMALDRYSQGAQVMVLRCRKSDAAVKSAKPGDWRIVQLSWMPDYQSRKKGINRIAQVMQKKSLDAAFVELYLVDGGPNLQAMTAPTVSAPVAQADGTVKVSVTALPYIGTVQTEADIQYTIVDLGAAAPASDGAWLPLARAFTLGDYFTPPMPAGKRVWIRYRGVKEGRRPSLWSASAFVEMPAVPRLNNVAVTINAAGQPVVSWERLTGAEGVRIAWAVHAAGAAPPATFTTTADYDIDAGIATLPVTLGQREQISLRVIPYAGWTGSAVSGAAGEPSSVFTRSREDLGITGLPVVREVPTVTGAVGTLTLEIDDPQRRVTQVEFQTQVGSDPASGWSVDAVVPYQGTVGLIEKHVSRVGYRVSGYLPNGTIAVLVQNVVEFSVATKPGLATIVWTMDGSGNVGATIVGDFTTVSHKILASKLGIPTAADIRATSAIAGRVVTTGTLVTLLPGERAWLATLSYSADASESDRSQVAADRPTAGTSTGQNPPNAYIATVTDNVTSEEFQYSGALGVGGVGPLEWRRAIDLPGAPGAFSAWVALPAAPETIVRHAKQDKTVILEVRDVGTGAIDRTLRIVEGRMVAVDHGTGKKRRAETGDDGSYDQKSETNDGRRLTSDAEENQGRQVRRLYAKTLFGDPDTLLSIVDDASYRKTSISYIDGSNRPYALHRGDGSQRIEAEEIQKWFGRRSNNLVANGGAQSGSLGGFATSTGWTFGAGNGMQSTVSGSPKEGDRQWVIGNGGAGLDSYHYQDIACADGDVFLLSAQIRAEFLAAGTHVRLRVLPNAGVSFVIYEKVTHDEVGAGEPTIGFAWASFVTYPHEQMQTVFKTVGAGTFRIYAQVTGQGTGYFDAIEVIKLTPEQVKRLFGVSSGEGQLAPNVTQPTGGQTRNMMRGYQSGLCQDGVAVTFSPPYNATPHLRFPHVPSFQGDSTKWSTPGSYSATKLQAPVARGDPLSTTGFTPYLKIKQKTAGTLRQVEFDVAPVSVTEDDPTGPAQNVGAKAFGANMPATDNQYTVLYSLFKRCQVAKLGGYGEIQATVRVFTSPDAGSTWNLRGTRTHGLINETGGTITETDYNSFVINESGLDATDLVRLQLYAIYLYGDAVNGQCWATLTGSDNSPTAEGHGITWFSGGSEITASMTPDPDDFIRWEAWEEATA